MGCTSSTSSDADGATDLSKPALSRQTLGNASLGDAADALTSAFVKQHWDASDLEAKYDLSGSRQLGKGAFGVVRTCKRLGGGGGEYALKTISLDFASASALKELKNEIDIQRAFDHPHIARIIETFYAKPTGPTEGVNVHILMESLAGGSCKTRLRDNGGGYSEALVAQYMRQMVSATLHCHEHGVVHRDIKLENFVFERAGDDAALKLIDFGLSVRVASGDRLRDQVGTVAFMAPEQLGADKGGYGAAVDVWALGVCTYELLAGPFRRPYNTGRSVPTSHSAQLRIIQRAGAPKPLVSPVSPAAASFLDGALALQPGSRPSAEELLRHPFFRPEEAERVARGAGRQSAAKVRSCMTTFSHLTPLERLAWDAVAFCTPPAALHSIRTRIAQLDADGSGSLSRAELAAAFGEALSAAQVDTLFAAIDLDSSGVIEYSEIVGPLLSGAGAELDSATVAAAFEALDADESGTISSGEVMSLLGSSWSDDVAAKFKFVAGEDGELDLAEFEQLLATLGEVSRRNSVWTPRP